MPRIINCIVCRSRNIDKGRGYDGRRAYRCNDCGQKWTQGMQGLKEKKYNVEGRTYQFKDNNETYRQCNPGEPGR